MTAEERKKVLTAFAYICIVHNRCSKTVDSIIKRVQYYDSLGLEIPEKVVENLSEASMIFSQVEAEKLRVESMLQTEQYFELCFIPRKNNNPIAEPRQKMFVEIPYCVN